VRFDVGFIDRIFGPRVTIEVPTESGTRSVAVTEKWLAQMEREGKMPSRQKHLTARNAASAKSFRST